MIKRKKWSKYLFSFIVFFTTVFSFELNSKEINIIYKIDNDIITNIDIKNEINYLVALNKQLSDLDEDQLFLIGKNSILREKIKKKEILKFTSLGKKDEVYDLSINQIINNLNLLSVDDLKSYLAKFELTYNEIYEKIEIETLWNQLVYNTYKEKVVINENELREIILNNREKQEQYNLSEILYEYKSKDEIITIHKNILNSINQIGFEKTVALFSLADSKKNSGKLGWINKNVLSEEIINKLENIEFGEITEPIIIPSGILVLRLEDKKIIDKTINIDEELEKMIAYEMNSQLNIYSQILFEKIKNKSIINEY